MFVKELGFVCPIYKIFLYMCDGIGYVAKSLLWHLMIGHELFSFKKDVKHYFFSYQSHVHFKR